MIYFSPNHKCLTIYGESSTGSPLIAKFKPNSKGGFFFTDSPELIEFLDNHKYRNELFVKKDSDVVEPAPIQSIAADFKDYIRYGELKATLFKKDGNLRQDAVMEQVQEFNKLKETIERDNNVHV